MLLIVLIVLISSEIATPEPNALNTIQIIEKYNYPHESHMIQTEDGYILTYNRIPKCCQRPVVLLMHGILSSSFNFVLHGPNQSLAFLLSDAGYDVWLANARGNSWSRNHTHLDPDLNPKEFFDFSWHEIGYYDLPAAIDYIQRITQQEQINYVGHSQGGTSFFVMGVTRPEYQKKIKLAALLAPASFREHESHFVLRILGNFIYELEDFFNNIAVFEFPAITDSRRFLSQNCQKPQPLFRTICKFVYVFFGGSDNDQLDLKSLPAFFSHTPSHVSVKQLYHYGQLIRNGGFTQYDHGPVKNKRVYGTVRPPQYDLRKITAPVSFYYAIRDQLIPLMDIRHCMSLIRNIKTSYMVPHPTFGHLDFLDGRNVVELVYRKLISDLNSVNNV